MSDQQFTVQQIKNWRAYEHVRVAARYNMFDPRARIATGLSGEDYSFVMKNYAGLKVAFEAWLKPRKQNPRPEAPHQEYEPEQAWGSPDHFRKHKQFGGTREDY